MLVLLKQKTKIKGKMFSILKKCSVLSSWNHHKLPSPAYLCHKYLPKMSIHRSYVWVQKTSKIQTDLTQF